MHKQITRAEKQYAIVKRPLTIENHLCRRKNNPRLTASDTIKIVLQHILLFGEPLRASTTKYTWETSIWRRTELRYSNNVEDWAIRMVIT